MIEIYVAGTANPATNIGGWGAVVIEEEGLPKKTNGSDRGATAPRMVLKAAIEALGKTQDGSEVKLLSNNQPFIVMIRDSWQRKANRDLWQQLDELTSRRHVYPEYIAKHRWLSEAQQLARDALEGRLA